MKLHELSPAAGSRRARKRVGRGTGSGTGKTSARGQKGQKARSGGGVRPGFEGGQMPLARRIPKRGFTNIFATEYATVNVSELERFEDGQVVDIDLLMENGLVGKPKDGLKILGNGELKKKLTVKAQKFTKGAKEKIESAGGTAEEVKAVPQKTRSQQRKAAAKQEAAEKGSASGHKGRSKRERKKNTQLEKKIRKTAQKDAAAGGNAGVV